MYKVMKYPVFPKLLLNKTVVNSKESTYQLLWKAKDNIIPDQGIFS